MSSPPVQPWPVDDAPTAPWGSDADGTARPVTARPLRLAYFSCGDTVPAVIDRAATALGVIAQPIPLGALIDGTPIIPELIWADIDEDPGLPGLLALRQRIDEEALVLVIEASRATIDPLWALLGDTEGVTLLFRPEEGDCLAALAQGVRATRSRLNSPMVDARDQQLERLQEEVQRIARLLARLTMDDADQVARMPDGSRVPASPFIEDHMHAPTRGFLGEGDGLARAPVSAAQVRMIIRQRRLRDEYFGPDLFADPAWDMMLDLYAARLERLRVSVSSLCIAAAVPATTALRWIRTLTEAGVFERREDPHDGRRIFVALSDQATQGMHRYFHRIAQDV